MMAQLATPEAAAKAHQEIFSYWASLRRDGRLPARADIDPARLRKLLPTVSLTDVVGAPVDYRVRLAGTGLYPVYGGEITGKGLRDIYSREAAGYWRTELDKVVRLKRPAVGCHNLAWRGASNASLIWMRLPLSSDGESVDIILGYDALIGVETATSGIRAA